MTRLERQAGSHAVCDWCGYHGEGGAMLYAPESDLHYCSRQCAERAAQSEQEWLRDMGPEGGSDGIS